MLCQAPFDVPDDAVHVAALQEWAMALAQGARVQLSSELLIELLNAIYFALFKEVKDARVALNDVSARAGYELLPDVLLVTNAIHNSLMSNPSGQPGDGPIGISVAVSNPTLPNKNALGKISMSSFLNSPLADLIVVCV